MDKKVKVEKTVKTAVKTAPGKLEHAVAANAKAQDSLSALVAEIQAAAPVAPKVTAQKVAPIVPQSGIEAIKLLKGKPQKAALVEYVVKGGLMTADVAKGLKASVIFERVAAMAAAVPTPAVKAPKAPKAPKEPKAPKAPKYDLGVIGRLGADMKSDLAGAITAATARMNAPEGNQCCDTIAFPVGYGHMTLAEVQAAKLEAHVLMSGFGAEDRIVIAKVSADLGGNPVCVPVAQYQGKDGLAKAWAQLGKVVYGVK